LPYFTRYWAANFSLSLGSQRKHSDLARSCSLHQSPFFLNAAATLALHWLQISSGTPCSSHHQPLWSWSFWSAGFARATWTDLSFACPFLFSAWPQPVSIRTMAPMRAKKILPRWIVHHMTFSFRSTPVRSAGSGESRFRSALPPRAVLLPLPRVLRTTRSTAPLGNPTTASGPTGPHGRSHRTPGTGPG